MDQDISSEDEEVDITPEDLEEHAAAIYPVAPTKHVGVNTDEGTDPVETDQGDEQVRASF